ncbi:MAG: cytochrome c5 family protein, partial [Zoogloea sp.]|nr:cytochrome c5 family protein [Zoogloea sp.]
MQKSRPAHLRALRSALPFALVVVAAQLAGCGSGKPGVDEETSAKLVQPVAHVELQAAPAAAAGSRTGEDIFKNVCSACHAAGVAGAPKAGDKAAWGPRIA